MAIDQQEQKPQWQADLEGRLRSFIPQDTIDSVDREQKRWRPALRKELEEETRLVRVDGRIGKFSVDYGLPLPLAERLCLLSDDALRLLPRLPLILATREGLSTLSRTRPHVAAVLQTPPETLDALGAAGSLVDKLVHELEVWKNRLEFGLIEEDVLGSYWPQTREIKLHALAICLFAALVNMPVDRMTVVVTAHEMAHAYTHIGQDIQHNIWDTEAFMRTSNYIREGLAQYIACKVCNKMDRRLPGCSFAFETLEKNQCGAYVVHRDWLNRRITSEEVRLAMLQVRLRNLMRPDDLDAALEQARRQIGDPTPRLPI